MENFRTVATQVVTEMKLREQVHASLKWFTLQNMEFSRCRNNDVFDANYPLFTIGLKTFI